MPTLHCPLNGQALVHIGINKGNDVFWCERTDTAYQLAPHEMTGVEIGTTPRCLEKAKTYGHNPRPVRRVSQNRQGLHLTSDRTRVRHGENQSTPEAITKFAKCDDLTETESVGLDSSGIQITRRTNLYDQGFLKISTTILFHRNRRLRHPGFTFLPGQR